MRSVAQYAGETAEQYVSRLESELTDALSDLDDMEDDARLETERLDALRREFQDDVEERDFLRDQLTELAQAIRSPSAPRSKQQMARLIAGLLRGEDWRNGAWR